MFIWRADHRLRNIKWTSRGLSAICGLVCLPTLAASSGALGTVTAASASVPVLTAAYLAIAVQLFVIIALVWERTHTRKAIATLFESEERFERMAEMAPVLIWMSDQHGNIKYMNGKRLEFIGKKSETDLRDSWMQCIHPAELDDFQSASSRALCEREGFTREYRIRRRDGAYRWMLDTASPRTHGNGSFAGFVGWAIDVTEQKLARESLDNVGGRLIEAQEKERSRIARELHDDIGQRLALLSCEMEQAIADSKSERNDPRWALIQQHCNEITGDVQALSHELHSSKLDYLGLGAAVRSFCSEFSKQHRVSVAFEIGSIPKVLPGDVSLCLFRIVQEGLRNGFKHSGAREFSVRLNATREQVSAEIRDAGIGFDPNKVKGSGLGLVSMQERIHLAGGSITIDSKLNRGTTIGAKIPLKTMTALRRAAGAG